MSRKQQINVRMNEQEMRLIAMLRRARHPIPGVSSIIREALQVMREHDKAAKKNGHGGRLRLNGK